MIHMLDTPACAAWAMQIYGAKDLHAHLADLDKLALKGFTVTDVADAIREQNGLHAATALARPNENPVEFTIPVITRRLI